ncbi:E3 ubiquitin-protein ligase SDIR1-like [Solanum pennellii]|uniref:RING-type E3 ubiquitin transferase n=1 Tax=Solanum pennellii TaxID=28526 RepID=A0ABM1HDX6_SOLPN|nr:E3 ubiquitin-protein ligase SDIR1-like [Solanum pennellii]
MFPSGFVSHVCFKNPFVSVEPIVSSSSYSLTDLTIKFNFSILKRFWYIRPKDEASEYRGRIWEDCSTKSTQIINHLSDTMLYEKLDNALSQVSMHFKHDFEDQQHVIVEQTARKLLSITTTSEMSEVCVDVELQIDHYCDGRIMLALEESSSVDGMVPASESSIKLLEPMEDDERNSNDECLVCLDELGEETNVLRLPCSHMFHAQCITKWLQNSHYCSLCRFEMPTD